MTEQPRLAFAEVAAAEVARARSLHYYEANYHNAGSPKGRPELEEMIARLLRTEGEMATPDIRRAIVNSGHRVSIYFIRDTLIDMQDRGEVTHRRGISKGSRAKFWRLV